MRKRHLSAPAAREKSLYCCPRKRPSEYNEREIGQTVRIYFRRHSSIVMQILSDGSCRFQSALKVPGDAVAPFTVGPGWLVEVITIRSGKLYFLLGDVEVRSRSKRFAIYYSPFSI